MTVAPPAPVPFILLKAGGPIVASDTELYRPPWQPDTQLGDRLVGWWSSRVRASLTVDDAGGVSAWRSLVGDFVATHINAYDGPKPIYEAAGWQYRDIDGNGVGFGPAVRFPVPPSSLAGSMLRCENFPRRDGKTTYIYLAAERHDGALPGKVLAVRPMVTIEPPLLPSGKRPQVCIGFVNDELDPAKTMLVAGGHIGSPDKNNARVDGVTVGRQFAAAASFSPAALAQVSYDGGDWGAKGYSFDSDAPPNHLTIGGWPDAGFGHQPCRIAEVMIVTDPTPQEHAALMGYCIWTTLRSYALPDTHPYRLDGPRMP